MSFCPPCFHIGGDKGGTFMNLKSGRIEGFEEYSQFKNVKEFNTHIEMWLAV